MFDIVPSQFQHDRNGELQDSIKQGSAKVVLHGDKITGYTSGLTYFNC